MDCAEVHGLGWTAQKHGREELPLTQVQGRQRRGATQSEVRGSSPEELPKSEVRGGGQEEQPHSQGAVAARAQEGLEELSHVEGQEGPQ